MWAAFIYLLCSIFSDDMAYVETLTIYSGLFFAALISACCDYIKEYQFTALKDEINNQQIVVFRGAN
jgi:hypothetical protein